MTERTITLSAELLSVRTGRQFARDVVLEWGLERLSDDVQLGVSELLSNAVRHAGTDVEMSLKLNGRLVVEVHDSDPDLRRPVIPNQTPYATSGRGLQIVSAISDDWGIRATADGKVIWFSLALPESGTPDADILAFGDRHDERDYRGYDDSDSGESRQMQARAAI